MVFTVGSIAKKIGVADWTRIGDTVVGFPDPKTEKDDVDIKKERKEDGFKCEKERHRKYLMWKRGKERTFLYEN